MFLSIILPIYNKESFIETCLQSLLKQNISFDDYEIICVDDGSTDKTPNIINKYLISHKNIKYIKKENGGVSSARNVGLKIAIGNYIWFIDPDDYIQDNILKAIKSLLINYNYDRLRIGFKRINEYGTDINNEIKLSDGTVWGSIIKKKIIDDFNICFNENISHQEDTLFMLNCIIHETNTSDYKNPCYFYRQNSQSLTAGKSKFDQFRRTTSYINSTIEIKKIYDKYTDDFGCSKEFLLTHLLFAMQPTFNDIAQYPPYKVTKHLKTLKTAGAYPFHIPKYYKKNNMAKFKKIKIKNRLINCSMTRFGFGLLYVYYLPDRVKNYIKTLISNLF